MDITELAKKIEIRTLFDIQDVVYDKEWLSNINKDINLYYMYRDIALKNKDEAIIKKNGLRFDVMTMPARMLGEEFVKTAGHYHPLVTNTEITFPEFCEVYKGEANYILQKLENGSITDVVLIKAKEKDKIIIPPGYGHITVNISEKELKVANWVADGFKSLYTMREKGGGAYFILKSGIIKNSKYDNIPNIRECDPANNIIPELKHISDIYGLVKEIDKLKFLTNPRNYKQFFNKLLV